jgi:hypothetical protein
MASITWQRASTTDAFTGSTLNSLANNGRVLGLELDNSGGDYLFDDIEFFANTFGGTPSAGAVIELYLIPIGLDGTNYTEGTASVDPPSSALVGVYNIRNVATAQRHMARMVTVPPSKFKYLVINKTGQALSASGNTCTHRFFRYQTQ